MAAMMAGSNPTTGTDALRWLESVRMFQDRNVYSDRAERKMSAKDMGQVSVSKQHLYHRPTFSELGKRTEMLNKLQESLCSLRVGYYQREMSQTMHDLTIRRRVMLQQLQSYKARKSNPTQHAKVLPRIYKSSGSDKSIGAVRMRPLVPLWYSAETSRSEIKPCTQSFENIELKSGHRNRNNLQDPSNPDSTNLLLLAGARKGPNKATSNSEQQLIVLKGDARGPCSLTINKIHVSRPTTQYNVQPSAMKNSSTKSKFMSRLHTTIN